MSAERNCSGCDEEQGYIQIQSSILISKMFKEVTDIEANQNHTLCKSCNQELKACYNFKRRCIEIDNLYNEKNRTEDCEVEEADACMVSTLCNSEDEKFETIEKEIEVIEVYDEEENVKTEENLPEAQEFEEIITECDSPVVEAEPVEYLTDLENRFQCPDCPKTFGKKSSLVTHQLSHHLNRRDCVCPENDCNSAYNVFSRLTRHLRNVHKKSETEIKSFITAWKKDQSIEKKINQSIRTVEASKVQCDICLKVYKSLKYLKEHRLLQHCSDDAPYKCEQVGCSKKFTDWSLLEKHQKAHEGLFDYNCEYCGKGFVQRKVLNQHLKKSHQISQEKINEIQESNSFCTDCNLSYKSPQKLAEHKALEHGNGEKLFVCDICAKVFLSKVKLMSHQKYHQKEKEVSCSRCPSTFTEERGLKTHLRRVHELTEEKIFEAFLKH